MVSPSDTMGHFEAHPSEVSVNNPPSCSPVNMLFRAMFPCLICGGYQLRVMGTLPSSSTNGLNLKFVW